MDTSVLYRTTPAGYEFEGDGIRPASEMESIFQSIRAATPWATASPNILAVRRNMIISLEDAVGLLSKWKSESTLVFGLLMGDGASVAFSGVITDLESHGLVVTQHLGSGQKAVEALVGFESVSQFEYRDSREVPPNIQEKLGGAISSVLMMKLPASTLLLFESPTVAEPGER